MRILLKPRPALRILERHVIDRRHINHFRNRLAGINTKPKPKPLLDAYIESRLRSLYAEDIYLLKKLVGLDQSLETRPC